MRIPDDEIKGMKVPEKSREFPMPNPFAGMNPYLERPEYWSDFHNQLVAAIARSLVPKLVPKYRVVTDKGVYKIAGSTAVAIGRQDISAQQNRRSNAPTNTNPPEGNVAVCPLPEPVEDWTKQGIANELLDAGVPAEDIVLGFQHPSKRPFTEFAIS